MALRDYILCKKCECKLIYDGGDSARDWLEERWRAPDASMWTELLLCPDCIKALEAELAECRRLLRRYYTETPLGHQPHMIAHEAEAAITVEGEK